MRAGGTPIRNSATLCTARVPLVCPRLCSLCVCDVDDVDVDDDATEALISVIPVRLRSRVAVPFFLEMNWCTETDLGLWYR